MRWGKDFDIVIAHRGPWMGLWATITSCEIALKGSDFKYGYTIVVNGEKELPKDLKTEIANLKFANKLTNFMVHPSPLSPPTARQLGTLVGDGDRIFFFDNHCLVQPNYFSRAIEQMTEKKIEYLHSTTLFHANENRAHEYLLQLDRNFWATHMKPSPVHKHEPYRVAMGGAGGFVVDRKVWQEVGGYWTGFVGYGGEESYFDLKMWLLGKEVWLDPELIHYHFAGERNYPRHFTDDYFRNMLMCANIIGGEKWLWMVYDKFSHSSKANTGKLMLDLLMEAQQKSAAHAQNLQGQFIRSLDEQLALFEREGISH